MDHRNRFIGSKVIPIHPISITYNNMVNILTIQFSYGSRHIYLMPIAYSRSVFNTLSNEHWIIEIGPLVQKLYHIALLPIPYRLPSKSSYGQYRHTNGFPLVLRQFPLVLRQFPLLWAKFPMVSDLTKGAKEWTWRESNPGPRRAGQARNGWVPIKQPRALLARPRDFQYRPREFALGPREIALGPRETPWYVCIDHRNFCLEAYMV